MEKTSVNTHDDREKIIIRSSFIGIGVNILLAAFKAFVGILSNSISVTLDAVNNLSDALSSVITIIGTRLAGKAPDKKHPYGYGRIEYLSSSIIAFLVLYAGITSLTESVKKILHPEKPDYQFYSLIIIASAVVAKILLGLYVKARGKEVDSDSLINSGNDALLDSVLSASTLVAALLFLKTGISLEAYLGLLISFLIIKSGTEMLRDSISRVLGERVDSSLSKAIKADACSVEGVLGAYDLILTDYGPDRTLASIHVEVPDTMTAVQIDKITRQIQHLIYARHHVIITAVGIYSHNTTNSEALQLKDEIQKYISDHEYILQMHGFYFDPEKKNVRFDVVIDFSAPDRYKVHEQVVKDMSEKYPDYHFFIALDADISD